MTLSAIFLAFRYHTIVLPTQLYHIFIHYHDKILAYLVATSHRVNDFLLCKLPKVGGSDRSCWLGRKHNLTTAEINLLHNHNGCVAAGTAIQIPVTVKALCQGIPL